MNVHVVIMAGGIGSRFWPISTPELPKQFIDILGCGRTLIQLTADRFEGVCDESRLWVVTNAGYVSMVRSQLPGIPENHILAEPAARNTAPCIAWACWRIKEEDPDANIVVAPSDAYVADVAEFRRVIGNALAFTEGHDAIVTVGIKPTRPETGYGYVEADAAVTRQSALQQASAASQPTHPAAQTAHPAASQPTHPTATQPAHPAAAQAIHPAAAQATQPEPAGIFPVKSFREKPDSATAQAYLAAGTYLWNAGIFVWNIRTLENAVRTWRPGIAADMDLIARTGDVASVFPGCEKISIDYAVMEPAASEGKVYTHPASFGWSDLGNWASLYDRLPADGDGNAAVGNVKFVECRGCIAHAVDSEQVVLQGLENCIISVRKGRMLVCRRDQEQRIRDFAAAPSPSNQEQRIRDFAAVPSPSNQEQKIKDFAAAPSPSNQEQKIKDFAAAPSPENVTK